MMNVSRIFIIKITKWILLYWILFLLIINLKCKCKQIFKSCYQHYNYHHYHHHPNYHHYHHHHHHPHHHHNNYYHHHYHYYEYHLNQKYNLDLFLRAHSFSYETKAIINFLAIASSDETKSTAIAVTDTGTYIIIVT